MPEPAAHREGEGTLVPRPPDSGRGWAQLEVICNVSLRPPEVTRKCLLVHAQSVDPFLNFWLGGEGGGGILSPHRHLGTLTGP